MNIEEKFESAFETYNKGNLSQAEKIFDETVRFQPNITDALYVLAEISYLISLA